MFFDIFFVWSGTLFNSFRYLPLWQIHRDFFSFQIFFIFQIIIELFWWWYVALNAKKMESDFKLWFLQFNSIIMTKKSFSLRSDWTPRHLPPDCDTRCADVTPDKGQILKIRRKTREGPAGKTCQEVGATRFLWKCHDCWKGPAEHQSPSRCSGCSGCGAF